MIAARAEMRKTTPERQAAGPRGAATTEGQPKGASLGQDETQVCLSRRQNAMERLRLRGFACKEQALLSWQAAMTKDRLGKWATNQMPINVSTRKFEPWLRLPKGDWPAPNGPSCHVSIGCSRGETEVCGVCEAPQARETHP
ncbi:MAG: hypothetical protein WAM29_16225 [Methylocella sp.]